MTGSPATGSCPEKRRTIPPPSGEPAGLLHIYPVPTIQVISLMWGYAYYRGKKIIAYMRRRHAARWEEMNRPEPDYFNSLKLQRWKRFLSGEEYRSLNDRWVNELCEQQLMLERTAIVATVLFFVVFGAIALWDKYWLDG